MAISSTRYGGTTAPLERACVAEAMGGGVISVAPSARLRAVAELMARHRIHAVYVFDSGTGDDGAGDLWGLVSDLDLVVAACADLDSMTARDAAITPLVTILSNDTLARAAQRMAETGVAHLAVIDACTRRPVGVLSTLDIAAFLAGGGGCGKAAANPGDLHSELQVPPGWPADPAG